MATKTFNIGEYAVGGRIVVTVNAQEIKISAKDWDTKQVVEERTFPINADKFDVQLYLEDEITSSYYTEKIMDFIYPK